MSPTAVLLDVGLGVSGYGYGVGWWEGVPGMGDDWVGWEGYTRYPTRPVPGPIFSYF